jgi:putative selenate reductase
MTQVFSCFQIDHLLKWILEEEKTGQIFGIHKDLFFTPHEDDVFRMERYGQVMETPLGVAAGPHTQLSQNIISAWLSGARYIELKTVQTLDELDVTRPCIDMSDEGYNCEWSQELKLDQSFSEYLNAWILLHVLKDKFKWSDPDTRGFIFNMSVGYNLEGILNTNVQLFLDRMENCQSEKESRIREISKIYPGVVDLDIPDRICDSITISTMHGCPPDEIEKIAQYFIRERKLHTTIKLNPTLLGQEKVRHILNDRLGYDVEVPDLAFEHDLKYDAGVSLIETLLRDAASEGVSFNLKLTNTLETTNIDQNLPDNEKMVYMSGRALHPISINLAQKLQSDFDGRLDISFSAGVDCFNISDILACNISPVTICSDILKPGGYGRISQYLEEIKRSFEQVDTRSIHEFIVAQATGKGGVEPDGYENLERYADAVIEDKMYLKSTFPFVNIKTDRDLTSFDCIEAPCVTTCPANQDVPLYMYYTASGEYEKAWETILDTNPFPRVQGMVCDHPCQTKCTRMNYESPLLIREIKRFVAQQHAGGTDAEPAPANGKTVAILGAGPSGLSCAHYLALSGFTVDVYESKNIPGGMAADGIPLFRLDQESLEKDIEAILSLGVRIHYGEGIDSEKFQHLRKSYDYVYIAVGAQKGINLGIPGEEAAGVMDQLNFLSLARRGTPPELGEKVVIIGGGSSAIDAARTAKRLVGRGGDVSIIYRRTLREMPAEHEEVQTAIEEGVNLFELAAPECLLVENGKVTTNVCFRMELGEKDESGRRRPIRIDGSEFHIEADSVISAIGQKVDLDFYPDEGLEINPETLETSLPNVFAGGDAVRGASSLIHAIADGKRAAEAIKKKETGKGDAPVPKADRDVEPDVEPTVLQVKQAKRLFSPKLPDLDSAVELGFDLITETLDEKTAQEEAARCLQCDILCNICTTVCPNRANIAYSIDPIIVAHQQVMPSKTGPRIEDIGLLKFNQTHQIINLGDFCNECGNCSTFCPTNGDPSRIKPTFFLTNDSFSNADTGYMLDGGVLHFKNKEGNESISLKNNCMIYETPATRVKLNRKTFTIEEVEYISNDVESIELKHAVQMGVMLINLRSYAPLGVTVEAQFLTVTRRP